MENEIGVSIQRTRVYGKRCNLTRPAIPTSQSCKSGLAGVRVRGRVRGESPRLGMGGLHFKGGHALRLAAGVPVTSSAPVVPIHSLKMVHLRGWEQDEL